MYLTGMRVNSPNERTSTGVGRAAAFEAANSCTITTARDAAGDLTGTARETFLDGFRAWERASESETGIARGVEHWVRRALAERRVLLGGRLRVEPSGAFAVLSREGLLYAEAWPEDGGWRWQVEAAEPPPAGEPAIYVCGEGLAGLVQALADQAAWRADALDPDQIVTQARWLTSAPVDGLGVLQVTLLDPAEAS
jgi:hypothetical protein